MDGIIVNDKELVCNTLLADLDKGRGGLKLWLTASVAKISCVVLVRTVKNIFSFS